MFSLSGIEWISMYYIYSLHTMLMGDRTLCNQIERIQQQQPKYKQSKGKTTERRKTKQQRPKKPNNNNNEIPLNENSSSRTVYDRERIAFAYFLCMYATQRSCTVEDRPLSLRLAPNIICSMAKCVSCFRWQFAWSPHTLFQTHTHTQID